MLILIPVNLKISKKLGKIQKTVMEAKDVRIKTINELLNGKRKEESERFLQIFFHVKTGIRLVKLFAWETSFVTKVSETRDKELSSLW